MIAVGITAPLVSIVDRTPIACMYIPSNVFGSNSNQLGSLNKISWYAKRARSYGSVAAETKKGFLPVTDNKDGYTFLYPFGWQVNFVRLITSSLCYSDLRVSIRYSYVSDSE